MRLEAPGQRGERAGHLLDALPRHGRLRRPVRPRPLHPRPGPGRRTVGGRPPVGAGVLVRRAERGLHAVAQPRQGHVVEHALRPQPVGVGPGHRRVRGHRPVHHRLGEGRIVHLVVPVLAVADQVHEHVAPEALAVGDRQPHDVHGRLGVVGVHVEDRRVLDAGHVGRVARGPRLLRRGGEPDLVVHDDVHRAAGVVARQRRHRQRLGHDALAGERGVAVEQHRQAAPPPRVPHAILLRPHRAQHDRVHELEVAGVVVEVEVDVGAAARAAVGVAAEVVLDVAVALDLLGQRRRLELAEDDLERLAEDVGEHVEAPAVGHAEDDLLHPVARRRLDQRVEHRESAPLRPRARSASAPGSARAGTPRSRRPRAAAAAAARVRPAPPAGGSPPPPCAPAARRAGPRRPGACTRRRWCRSRCAAGRRAARRAGRAGRARKGAQSTSRARSASPKPSVAGSSSDGQAGRSPSGSSRAARCPKRRWCWTSPKTPPGGPPLALERVGQLESGEEDGPVLGDRAGVRAEPSVHLFDEGSVRALDGVQPGGHASSRRSPATGGEARRLP